MRVRFKENFNYRFSSIVKHARTPTLCGRGLTNTHASNCYVIREPGEEGRAVPTKGGGDPVAGARHLVHVRVPWLRRGQSVLHPCARARVSACVNAHTNMYARACLSALCARERTEQAVWLRYPGGTPWVMRWVRCQHSTTYNTIYNTMCNTGDPSRPAPYKTHSEQHLLRSTHPTNTPSRTDLTRARAARIHTHIHTYTYT